MLTKIKITTRKGTAEDLDTIPSKIKQDNAGYIEAINQNSVSHSNKKRGKYKTKPKNKPLTREDHSRHRNTFKNYEYEFFDDYNFIFVTVKLDLGNAKRYKNESLAIKKIVEIIKDINKDALYVGCIELDLYHHPHGHFLIENDFNISAFQQKWNELYGNCSYKFACPYKDNNRGRLLNYCCKTYNSNENLNFNFRKAHYLSYKEKKLSKKIKFLLSMKYQMSKITIRNKIQALITQAEKEKYLIHNELKKECQKQLTKTPIFKTRGKKGMSYQENKNNKTLKELGINPLGLLVQKVLIQNYDQNTGQILSEKTLMNKYIHS